MLVFDLDGRAGPRTGTDVVLLSGVDARAVSLKQIDLGREDGPSAPLPPETAGTTTGGGGSDVINRSLDSKGWHIIGAGGDDILTGGRGADFIEGGEGFDRIVGGAGNDMIVGGRSFDRVVGGAGDDIFVFAAGDLVDPTKNGGQMDHITDFRGAGTSGTGEQNFLSFTGFGPGAQLVFQNYAGGKQNFQIYRVLDGAGTVQGSIMVQMADGTARVTSDDYAFY